ncbi:ATP-grasp domain-containing protein, partial [Photobacterium sanctipauli]|uniref:ATP-grasp domain-containing protein n=1 Tax=Photobacterium sanctipauli TaxID=1342794 RepID=UPI00156818D5
MKLGVSVARGELVDLTNTNYEQLSARFGDKFVLKPLQSFEISTLNKRNKVVSVKSNQDYIDFIKANASSTNFLVEEYFRGTGEGLSVFCSSGTVKSAFSYKRLAEPSSGGGSSYRESTPLDPELLKATQAICKETKLTGVAMFEFRRNVETGEWILIEVNARFWGGLPLAISSGVDFPKVYADFLCFDKEPQSINYNYRIGVRSRS